MRDGPSQCMLPVCIVDVHSLLVLGPRGSRDERVHDDARNRQVQATSICIS